VAHAKTRPSLWLEGFPILSVVHPHNRTLAGLLPPAAENYIVYYRGRNQTSHSILASITPRRRNRQCNRIQDCCITFGQVTLPIHFYAFVLPLTRSGTPWPDQVKQHLITISL